MSTATPNPLSPFADSGLKTDRAICLILTLTKLGNTKRVPDYLVDVDAERRLIRTTKKLLDSDEMDVIRRLDAEIRDMLYTRALPSPLKRGSYLIPYEIAADIDSKLLDYQERRSRAIDALETAYQSLLDADRGNLRACFNEMDYPSVTALRTKFTMAWRFADFGLPTKLREIAPSLFEREKEKAAETWAAAMAECQTLLRVSMAELVDHLTERLSGGKTKTGRKQVFRDSAIENVRAFLDTFDARNITNDEALQALVAETRELLAGVTGKTVRESGDVAIALKTGFDNIKQRMDTMLGDAPTRKISFEDE